MRGKIRLVCHRESWSTPLGRLALCVILVFSVSLVSSAQNYPAHPDWPGIGQLFVGTCYQPINRSPEQIDRDIAIMKHAGFNVVRMGDLSWDSFEPSQGKFSFDWFDNIMDKMHATGIRVILGHSRYACPYLAASSVPRHRYRQPERHSSSTC